MDSGYEQALAEAIAQHRRGDFGTAIAAYRSLLARNAQDVRVLANLGSALGRSGKMNEGLAVLERAITLEGSRADLWFNRANLLRDSGQVKDAEHAYLQAITCDTALLPPRLNLANLLRGQSRFAEASVQYQAALGLSPEHAVTLRAYARSCYDAGQIPEAEALYRRALASDPMHADTHNALGVVLKDLGRSSDALKSWERAIQLAPRMAAAHNNMGTMLRLLRQPEPAIKHLREAVRLEPNDATAMANLAHALLEIGQVIAADRIARRLISVHPKNAGGPLMLGFALTHEAKIEEAVAAFQQSLRLKPGTALPISNALFASLYSDQRDAARHLEFHRDMAGQLEVGPPFAKRAVSWDSNRPIRIGYLSPDFRRHPVSYFLEPILSNHDRARVTPVCYSLSAATDEFTEKLKRQSGEWRDCDGWTDDRLGECIVADEIDILVDLAGHTAHNRCTLLRRKPAPIQALYIGYPCTTGIPEVDWIIADDRVCPAECEQWYVERVARMAGSFWCYQPWPSAPEPGPMPCEKNGFITFGSFNTLPKISDLCVRLWARILAAVPGSQLVLRALAYADEAVREATRQRFVALGIEGSRIFVEPPIAGLELFLAEYRRIDIALDTLPYNGGTTTCETLWMGVPVVTTIGSHFFGRMSYSLLHSIGMQELAATDDEAYVRIAVELANDPASLATVRDGLRERMRASAICDAPRAAREVEDLFAMMMRDAAEHV